MYFYTMIHFLRVIHVTRQHTHTIPCCVIKVHVTLLTGAHRQVLNCDYALFYDTWLVAVTIYSIRHNHLLCT